MTHSNLYRCASKNSIWSTQEKSEALKGGEAEEGGGNLFPRSFESFVLLFPIIETLISYVPCSSKLVFPNF